MYFICASACPERIISRAGELAVGWWWSDMGSRALQTNCFKGGHGKRQLMLEKVVGNRWKVAQNGQFCLKWIAIIIITDVIFCLVTLQLQHEKYQTMLKTWLVCNLKRFLQIVELFFVIAFFSYYDIITGSISLFQCILNTVLLGKMPLPLLCQQTVKECRQSTVGCLGKGTGGSDWFTDFDNTASLSHAGTVYLRTHQI